MRGCPSIESIENTCWVESVAIRRQKALGHGSLVEHIGRENDTFVDEKAA